MLYCGTAGGVCASTGAAVASKAPAAALEMNDVLNFIDAIPC
jgi:hypothetical protein